MSLRAILFDIDGTLIDHDAAAHRAALELCDRLALPQEGFAERWDEAFQRHYARFMAGEVSLTEQRRARLREASGMEWSDVEADAMMREYLSDYLSFCAPYPDVAPMMDALRGWRKGIISNGERAQQQVKLQRAGIEREFECFAYSVELDMAKPDRRIFEWACQQMGVAPQEAVYVGDRRDVDAEGARRAGLTGIWLDRPGVGGAEGIRTLAELAALVTQKSTAGGLE